MVLPIIANLKPDDTQVKFKDMNVGKVESVELENDLRQMRVKLAFN
jgi:paraquat-inducible protein B